MPASSRPPLIGITADATTERFSSSRAYANSVAAVGGTPIILPCLIGCIDHYVGACDGFILSGGDDPIMTRWGAPMHPAAKPIDPVRQEFELALLEALDQTRKPVLGICLGMQLMGLHAGGQLNQHLPDTLPTADMHGQRGGAHEVEGELGCGLVHSHHHQALTDSGALRIVATASVVVIEAIACSSRPFYLGVQWHPERT